MDDTPVKSAILSEEGLGFDEAAIAGYAIQPAIWPEPDVPSTIASFFKFKTDIGIRLKDRGLSVPEAGSVSFDGYYNVFSLWKWRKYCGDQPIELHLHGQGELSVEIWLTHDGIRRPVVLQAAVNLDGLVRLGLDLPTETPDGAVLGFDIRAATAVELDDFAWGTSVAPLSFPKMTVSVTTFCREAEVASTLRRFAAFKESFAYSGYVDMVVVDNGRSLKQEDCPGVQLFPNRNFGGSSGFARGLIAARAQGSSHCLFMDDDASVHMRAIERTWMFLAYCKDPEVAVCGAMIDARHPSMIWENGARFDRLCKPLFHGLDLEDLQKVAALETKTTDISATNYYAGWWYFAFPISTVQHLPFPFFVRGDDVSFSLANDFKFVSLPGVASVQENFVDKASPMTWYLDLRSHLAHHLSLTALTVGFVPLCRLFISFYLRTTLRYHYESLAAVNLALQDVMKGPEFFVEDMGLEQRRKDLAAMTDTERWKPMSETPTIRRGRLPRFLRALFLITLNGHLMPFANVFASDLVVDADHRGNFREVYGAREITYINAAGSRAYKVKRDRRRFLAETAGLVGNVVKLALRYRKLRSTWQAAYPALTAEEFWREKLELDG